MLLVAPNEHTQTTSIEHRGYRIRRVGRRYDIITPSGAAMRSQASLKAAKAAIDAREGVPIIPDVPPVYNHLTGWITLAPNGRLYGANDAARRLEMSLATYRKRQERENLVSGVMVPASYLVTETALDAARSKLGKGPYTGPALPCAQAGPSGVLLTRAGAADMLGTSSVTLRRLPQTMLPSQRVAHLVLYRLEDIEARRGGKA
jgi:hypothetical protein